MSRFLACGDLHLDKGGRYGRVPGERLAEQEACWARALELGREHEVDAVLFCGDAFDKRHPSTDALLAFERPLVEYGGLPAPVIAIPGNHDRSGVSDYCALDVFAEAGLLTLHSRPGVTRIGDVAIACLPWAPVSRIAAAENGGDRDDVNAVAAELLLETARGLRSQIEGPAILLTHFSISGAVTPDGADVGLFREPVLDLDALDAIGFDCIVASHIHKPQILYGNEHSERWAFFTGSPMPLDFGEAKCDHGVWLLDDAMRPTFLPIASRPFVTLDWEYEVAETLLDLDPWKGCGRPFEEGAFVKLRYSCTAEDARHLDTGALRTALLDFGAHNAWIEQTIERELRARVSGLDETVSDVQALELFLDAVNVGEEKRPPLRALHADYLGKLDSTARGRAGAGDFDPIRLRATSYRDYADLDLLLPEGSAAIVGENGAGKSSLLEAIELALFAGRGELAQWLTVGGSSTELMLELTFRQGDAIYRVRRSYSDRGGGKTTLDLEREHAIDSLATADAPLAWEPLTLGTVKETDARLLEILGFGRNTFRAGAFCQQDEAGAFCQAVPSKRKETFSDMLGLDRFKQLLAAVRVTLAEDRQEITRIDGRLEGVTREELAEGRSALAKVVDQHAATIVLANTALTSWEGELEKAAEAVQAARDNHAARTATNARRDAALAALASLAKIRDDATEAGRQAQDVRDELATLPTPTQTAELEQREHDLLAAIDVHTAAERAYQDALTLHKTRTAEKTSLEGHAVAADLRMRELDAKVAHIEKGELDACPTCRQKLGVEARQATVGALRAEAQLLADEALALFERACAVELPEIPAAPEPPLIGDVLGVVQQQIRQARDADVQRSRLEERLAGLQRTLDLAATPEHAAALADAQAALQAVEAELAALPAAAEITSLEAAAVSVRGRVQAERERLQNAEREKAVATERLAQLTARMEQLERDLADRDKHLAQVDLLTVLERAYGADGIPALITESSAIPQLEAHANRILAALGGKTAGCRIELRTGRAKQDGGIKDTLDVIVVTEGGDRTYETFSGGERTRLNLSLRIGIALVLNSRLFALDEPVALDDDGKAALLEVLRDLERSGVFQRIYLVSHEPALREAFDQVIEVVKDESGRSRVEGQLEAVAA